MPVQNLEIAAALTEIADRLEIEGANPFRVRAYRNAARTVQEHPTDLKTVAARGESLAGTPGIGADLAGKIQEIATTGSCALLRQLRQEMPAAVTDLLKVPGLGPKRVKVLWHELEVETPEQVLRAARGGRIRAIHGFGEKTERSIEQALTAHLSKAQRVILPVAAAHAEALVRYLQAIPGVDQVVVAGSYRRRRETVGDLDILATAARGPMVTARFTEYPAIEATLSQGPTRASVRLRGGLQADLRVVRKESFGAALAYFTGSKAHNIALRRIAQLHGLKVNEYGVFRGTKRIAGETEESVYRAVGLPLIAPELREDRGELDAARDGRLPALVSLSELKGDLHVHTRATDGRDTLAEMAAAAQRMGFEYLAITEHSRAQAMSHGFDPARLRRQMKEIEHWNAASPGLRLLSGIEVDILEDGTLDLPDDVLSELDVVVAAIHSKFNLSRTRQTERLLRALDNPHLVILAHPTGRLIGEREPYDVDLPQLLRKARTNGIWLELNAQPDRLDLTDVQCRMCKDEGIPVAINSDAHSIQQFANLDYGVGQARRAWLTRGEVINTRPLPELLRALVGRARLRREVRFRPARRTEKALTS